MKSFLQQLKCPACGGDSISVLNKNQAVVGLIFKCEYCGAVLTKYVDGQEKMMKSLEYIGTSTADYYLPGFEYNKCEQED
jgi:ribosomal protein S27E